MKHIPVAIFVFLGFLFFCDTNTDLKPTILNTSALKNTSGTFQIVGALPLSDTGRTVKKVISGENLYKMYCASCHFPLKDFVGPKLAKCRVREPDKDWAYRFVRNPNQLLKTAPYAKALLAKYGSRTTAFNLSGKEVNAILDYCDTDKAPKPKR